MAAWEQAPLADAKQPAWASAPVEGAPKPVDASTTHEMALKRAKQFEDAAAAERAKQPGVVGNALGMVGGFAKGVGDTALNLGSQVVAVPAAGLAGIAQGAKNLVSPGMSAADRVAQVSNAMTYQPRSDVGKEAQANISAPVQWLGDKADQAGQVAANVTGSPLVGTAVNTAIQAAPALIAPEVRGAMGSVGRAAVDAGRTVAAKAGVGTIAAAPAAATAAVNPAALGTAKAYVANTLGLDWDALARATQDKLTSIAQTVGNFDNLDPAATARQARLEALNLPASRGQVTRNLAQLTREENLTKSDVGAPLADINAAQDEVLHGHIDTLRGQVGASPGAATRQGLGKSVQGATRDKAAALEADYRKAYTDAQEQGETAQPADISPLQDWLKNPTNARNAGYLKQAIQDYLPKDLNGDVIPGGERHISINDLEEIRKEASANRSTPGPTSHFAGEAIKVIDGILDDSGGDLYKSARAKFNAYNDEFSRQGSLAKLVDEKGQTTDRAVALEDTLDHVLKAPAENIADIKQSLTTGGTKATQAQGAQSWKDIQAGVLDYLKEKAAGKRAIVGDTSTAAGQKAFANNKELLQFNSAYRDAFSELDKDGKIDVIFDPKQAAMLRSIYDTVGDVRTKPTGRISGSDTVPRAIAMLESMGNIGSKVVSKVPIVGKVASAGLDSLREIAKKRADVAAATTTPLNQALAKANSQATRADLARQAAGATKLIPLSALGQRPQ
jgi:hypothetical protein